MTTPDEKKKKIQQKINKLKETEAKLKLEERKKRTRHLIELGGLVQKAGLDDLALNQLYGALLFLKDEKDRLEVLEKWEKRGGLEFSKDQKREETKTAVTLKFTSEPLQEIRQTLRTAGLRWNSLRQEWEGFVSLEIAKNLAHTHQAELQILSEKETAPYKKSGENKF